MTDSMDRLVLGWVFLAWGLQIGFGQFIPLGLALTHLQIAVGAAATYFLLVFWRSLP